MAKLEIRKIGFLSRKFLNSKLNLNELFFKKNILNKQSKQLNEKANKTAYPDELMEIENKIKQSINNVRKLDRNKIFVLSADMHRTYI